MSLEKDDENCEDRDGDDRNCDQIMIQSTVGENCKNLDMDNCDCENHDMDDGNSETHDAPSLCDAECRARLVSLVILVHAILFQQIITRSVMMRKKLHENYEVGDSMK